MLRCAVFSVCLAAVAAFSLVALSDAVVNFPDPGLEAAIREAIGKPVGDIYESDLVGLTYLDASERSISDLSGIEYCVNVRYLYLYGNQLSDITPLAGLTALTTLYLGMWHLTSNQVSDIGPLACLTALTALRLDHNQVSDLTSLAGLTALTSLNLSGNPISDITPLSGLTALAYLELWDNQISDLAPLAGLTTLTYLALSFNGISDLTPLAGLTALTYLNLGRNQISDVAPLAGLTALSTLRLFTNRIADITPLAGLLALTSLDLSANQVSDLSPLAKLAALTDLDLSGNMISDLSPLACLASLTRLLIGWNCLCPCGNLVSDIAPLTGLTQLAELDVATNKITSIHPLVHNAGIGAGDVVNVSYNYLCITPGSGEDLPDINVLLARGVSLDYDPQYACQEDGSAAAFRVTSAGDVRGDGAFYGADLFVGSADVAEWVTVAEAAEPGTVLELDTAHPGWYRPSEESCSGLVAGVVSSEPGVVLGGTEFTPGKALLAITGIVPVKVTNEGGPIQLGDLLVSSSTCGYAMRWAGDGPCPCSLVGKALEPMTDECGVISVLLTAH